MTVLWTVRVHKNVERRMATIPKPEREQIRKAINLLVHGPRQASQGPPGVASARGFVACAFPCCQGMITITVVALAPRGDVYKR
ncbi:MAG: hypothetical protein GX256_04920 [Fretibacterium sp.]|nr:hypothetical protein [Fretibacterium sp.]